VKSVSLPGLDVEQRSATDDHTEESQYSKRVKNRLPGVHEKWNESADESEKERNNDNEVEGEEEEVYDGDEEDE
jgi:hypothetical protein